MAETCDPKPEFFSSRWGVLFTALGMAIGTGDIWRFPPQVAANGGGAFLIPWMLFLFTWSIPLLIVEFGMGRAARRGTVGAFARLFGARFAWMGGFVGFCSLAIMFYYTVVTGWCLKYLWAALRGGIWEAGTEAYWNRFAQAGSWEPVWFQAAAMAVGCLILHRGVNRGLERANRVCIPVLFLLLAVAVVRAVTLPGAGAGLAFLYRPEWGRLADYEVWLAALSQSAWSTGAGWGLILTIGVYLRREETVVGHSLATGLGDNLASLLAASAILPTVFYRHTESQALELLGQGNTGLSFVVLPDIFREMHFGRAGMVLFFLALCLAAVSSLIAMIELGARILLDAGWTRGRAVWAVGAVGFLCGVPSALSLGFFANQDWVWGLGLTVSGVLFAAAIGVHGARSFRERHLHSPGERMRVGRWFDFLIVFLIPAQFLAMVAWWFFQAITRFDPEGWWNPLHAASVGTCILQWGLILAVLIALNRPLARWMAPE